MKKAPKKTNGSKPRGQRGAGRLYKRTPDGQEKPAGSNFKGVYWLEYRVDGKRQRRPLHDPQGEPISDQEEAEKARQKLVRNHIAGDRVERLKNAKAELEAAEVEYSEATEEANPPLTIAEGWGAYEASSERPDSGEGTLYNYKGHWDAFCEWLGEETASTGYLRDITPQTAKGYAAHLARRKVSPNTYNKHITFLRLFFTVLAEPARMAGNPFEKIQKKKLQTNTRRELSIAELQTILESAGGELKTLLYLGTFTGLRLGDCCTLKWGEVDLDRAIITRIPNKTKGRKSNPLKIGIPAALFQTLAATPKPRRRGYVLPGYAEQYNHTAASGKHTHRTRITNEIQKHLSKVCKIQIHAEGTGFQLKPDPDNPGEVIEEHTGKRAVVEVGFHSLRHTYVSLHAERGTPQAVVQAIVGHGNPAMTAHYTHIGEETARRVAGVLDSGITDAEFEVLPDPVPDWVREALETATADNWESIITEVLNVPGEPGAKR